MRLFEYNTLYRQFKITTMKHGRVKNWILSALAFLTFFAGIIRHDVDEKKYLALAAEKQFDCVGQIFKDTLTNASCVLISERFVLSAAHLFIEGDTRPDTIEFDGQKVVVYHSINERVIDPSKLSVLLNGHKSSVKNLILHPNYFDSLTKGSCDIALLELAQPLTGVLPAKVNAKYDELNSIVVGVGYGASGPANRPDLVDIHNKKIAGENVIDTLGGELYLGYPTIMMCDFDHSTNENCNKMGSAIPRPLEYICSGGDSGGGLFRQTGEEWELVGICSGSGVDVDQLLKTGYYGQTMGWTRTSVFTGWIKKETERSN